MSGIAWTDRDELYPDDKALSQKQADAVFEAAKTAGPQIGEVWLAKRLGATALFRARVLELGEKTVRIRDLDTVANYSEAWHELPDLKFVELVETAQATAKPVQLTPVSVIEYWADMCANTRGSNEMIVHILREYARVRTQGEKA